MTWNFMEIYFGIYIKYWKKEVPKKSLGGPIIRGAQPTPWVRHPRLWGTQRSTADGLLLYEAIYPRKKREHFRDFPPPSRGKTKVGAFLLSDGGIPPRKLLFGREKSKPMSSPMLLSSWEASSFINIFTNTISSPNTSSSLSSDLCIEPQVNTSGCYSVDYILLLMLACLLGGRSLCADCWLHIYTYWTC